MAVRWLYEITTGINFCVGMTEDDSQTEVPEDDGTLDRFELAWSDPDPSLEPPADRDLVPRKRYNVAQNRIYLCNNAQNQQFNLREVKHRKTEMVSRKTNRLFNKGFIHDGQRFALDADSRAYHCLLYTERRNNAIVTYPTSVTQRNRDEYVIDNANSMASFGEASILRTRYIVDGERDLRKQIWDATTVAEVIAIVDSRT